MRTTLYENWNWPYMQAVQWMDDARTQCLITGETSVAIGSHDHDIVTLGRHASPNEIVDAEYLRTRGIEVVRVDRGGGATLHGPGQVVLYPVVSLSFLQLTVPLLTELLEDALISCLLEFDIKAHKADQQPGVFVNHEKIGSIGLRVSKDIVTHGISLNVSNDLSLYSKISPCGKANATITSMAALLGENVNVSFVGRQLREKCKVLSLA